MTVGEWLAAAEAKLRTAKAPNPSRDALLLASHVLQRDKAAVLAHPEAPIQASAVLELESLLGRREKREPLQYIRGVHEFWGLLVRVGPGCLIPRPETEHLVEATLAAVRQIKAPKILEVGTGSGCVLMALGKERPDAVLVGVEKEPEALVWSYRNLGWMAAVQLMAGDLALDPPVTGFDAIVSNPPYITNAEWKSLPPEVRRYEPAAALRCGREPLGPYRQLAGWAELALNRGGSLLCELGTAQARRASALRHLSPSLRWVEGVRDLSGRLRVGVWRKE